MESFKSRLSLNFQNIDLISVYLDKCVVLDQSTLYLLVDWKVLKTATCNGTQIIWSLDGSQFCVLGQEAVLFDMDLNPTSLAKAQKVCFTPEHLILLHDNQLSFYQPNLDHTVTITQLDTVLDLYYDQELFLVGESNNQIQIVRYQAQPTKWFKKKPNYRDSRLVVSGNKMAFQVDDKLHLFDSYSLKSSQPFRYQLLGWFKDSLVCSDASVMLYHLDGKTEILGSGTGCATSDMIVLGKQDLIIHFELTPTEAARELMAVDAERSLEIAKSNGFLNQDWLKQTILYSKNSISVSVLQQVQDLKWKLQFCKKQVDSLSQAKELLQYGLELTNTLTKKELEQEMEDLLNGAQSHGRMDLYTERVYFITQLDLLDTFSLFGHLFEITSSVFYQFQATDLKLFAIELAKRAEIQSLDTMFTRHSQLLQHRMEILQFLPLPIHPKRFLYLMPQMDPATGKEQLFKEIPWRKDWTRDPSIVEIMDLLNDVERIYPATQETLQEWYRMRISAYETHGYLEFALLICESVQDLLPDLNQQLEILYWLEKEGKDLELDQLNQMSLKDLFETVQAINNYTITIPNILIPFCRLYDVAQSELFDMLTSIQDVEWLPSAVRESQLDVSLLNHLVQYWIKRDSRLNLNQWKEILEALSNGWEENETAEALARLIKILDILNHAGLHMTMSQVSRSMTSMEEQQLLKKFQDAYLSKYPRKFIDLQLETRKLLDLGFLKMRPTQLFGEIIVMASSQKPAELKTIVQDLKQLGSDANNILLQVARDLINNSTTTDKSTGNLKSALECLELAEQTADIKQEINLINATHLLAKHGLSKHGMPYLALEIRNREPKTSLLEELLLQDPKLYKKPAVCLHLGSVLFSDNPIILKTLIAKTALKQRDYESMVHFCVELLETMDLSQDDSPAVCDLSKDDYEPVRDRSKDDYEPVWDLFFEIAGTEDFEDTETKFKFVSLAVFYSSKSSEMLGLYGLLNDRLLSKDYSDIDQLDDIESVGLDFYQPLGSEFNRFGYHSSKFDQHLDKMVNSVLSTFQLHLQEPYLSLDTEHRLLSVMSAIDNHTIQKIVIEKDWTPSEMEHFFVVSRLDPDTKQRIVLSKAHHKLTSGDPIQLLKDGDKSNPWIQLGHKLIAQTMEQQHRSLRNVLYQLPDVDSSLLDDRDYLYSLLLQLSLDLNLDTFENVLKLCKFEQLDTKQLLTTHVTSVFLSRDQQHLEQLKCLESELQELHLSDWIPIHSRILSAKSPNLLSFYQQIERYGLDLHKRIDILVEMQERGLSHLFCLSDFLQDLTDQEMYLKLWSDAGSLMGLSAFSSLVVRLLHLEQILELQETFLEPNPEQRSLVMKTVIMQASEEIPWQDLDQFGLESMVDELLSSMVHLQNDDLQELLRYLSKMTIIPLQTRLLLVQDAGGPQMQEKLELLIRLEPKLSQTLYQKFESAETEADYERALKLCIGQLISSLVVLEIQELIQTFIGYQFDPLEIYDQTLSKLFLVNDDKLEPVLKLLDQLTIDILESNHSGLMDLFEQKLNQSIQSDQLTPKMKLGLSQLLRKHFQQTEMAKEAENKSFVQSIWGFSELDFHILLERSSTREHAVGLFKYLLKNEKQSQREWIQALEWTLDHDPDFFVSTLLYSIRTEILDQAQQQQLLETVLERNQEVYQICRHLVTPEPKNVSHRDPFSDLLECLSGERDLNANEWKQMIQEQFEPLDVTYRLCAIVYCCRVLLEQKNQIGFELIRLLSPMDRIPTLRAHFKQLDLLIDECLLHWPQMYDPEQQFEDRDYTLHLIAFVLHKNRSKLLVQEMKLKLGKWMYQQP
ncbi:secretory pathway protein Sec39-domain-containing protein [Gorgonomyces haynaldii]|nr:secretory pathway protein Sec39-domain-containing protein [Gorgonomyces haynaldii]